MPLFSKLFIRLILIIVIFLFYLKYRNNQCIKNQNCQPYFISHILSLKRNFEHDYIVIYKIIDNMANLNITTDPSYDIEKISNYKSLKKEEVDSKIYLATVLKNQLNYDDVNLIKNNDIIVKKFSLLNTGDFPIKVSPKMTYNDKFYKIYNCFCGSEVIVYPNLVKDIYIYFQVKWPANDFQEKENAKIDDFVITVSI